VAEAWLLLYIEMIRFVPTSRGPTVRPAAFFPSDHYDKRLKALE
jgi:hypothetical protein